MSDINWKDGAVCYFAKKQWFPNNGALGGMLKGYIHHYNYGDFQLNEIREGDYIPASELDTEQKYNEVVEVFELFGFKRFDNASYADTIKAKTDSSCLKVNPSGELICNWHKGDRQLTYHQIIAIGKLKRMMLERERSKGGYFDVSRVYNAEDFPKPDLEEKPKRRNKSKQAYDILKSLDYEYDLVKQRWFKKEYV